MERINAVCKTCNKPFSISIEQQKWLKERNMQPYTHCKQCREERKQFVSELRKSRDDVPHVNPSVGFGVNLNHPSALTTLAMLGSMFWEMNRKENP